MARRTCISLFFGILVFLSGTANSLAASTDDFPQLGAFFDSHPQPMDEVEYKSVQSNVYDLKVRWYASNEPYEEGSGGALVANNDILIFVGAKGRISWADLGRMQGFYETSIAAPLNLSGLTASGLVESSGMDVGWFRAAGAYLERHADVLRLFVSHHVYENGCFYLQLSAVDLQFSSTVGLYQSSTWRTLFRPDPCVRIGDASAHPFAGNQVGGKIVQLNDDELLVAFGDHEIDGFGTANAPQDPASPYGKVWRIAKDGSSHSLFAMGVRNPQGLFVDGQGRIWESEHGQRGGDELNLIRDGANYGWPLQNYGGYYGDSIWPLSPRQGDHSDSRFAPPIYAWIPSIAPTNLTESMSDRFDLWRGDLLLSTLKDEAIHRLRLVGDRVVYDERIVIGYRLRDIISLADGRLALLNDSKKTIGIVDTPGLNLYYMSALKTDNAVDKTTAIEKLVGGSPGARVFKGYCGSCHDLAKVGIGPPLLGVADREIGKYPGFTYSAGMAQSSLTWTRELLLPFMTDPKSVFPDTTMNAVGITNAEAEQLYDFFAGLKALEGSLSDGDQTADGDGDEFDPFLVPFTIGQISRVRSYADLLPGFWMGYDGEKNSAIYMEQELAPPQPGSSVRRYVFKIDVRDLSDTEWLTVERRLAARGDFELSVLLSAKMSTTDKVTVELYVPQKNAEDGKRTIIGEATLGPDMQTIEFKKLIQQSDFGDIDNERRVRVVVLLPLIDHLTAEFAEFKVSVGKAGQN